MLSPRATDAGSAHAEWPQRGTEADSGSMRRLLKTTIAAASLACAAGCAAALNYDDPAGPVLVVQQPSSRLATGEIRLVTFNVKWGEHVDRAADLLTRPGPLKDADVLFLQEMDGPGTEKLARTLGMNSIYVPSARHPSSRPRLRRRRSLALAAGRWAQGATPARTSFSKASACGGGGDGAYACR